MKRIAKRELISGAFFLVTPAFCLVLVVAVALLVALHGGNDVCSFEEPVIELKDVWTLTDSDGNSSPLSLPKTIEYGSDGVYTLTATLPGTDGRLTSPALMFYSNYIDVSISQDGVELYSFPREKAAFSGATGNTYHFVRLSSDYAGSTVTVKLRCQLGKDITYLINPPFVGSKATMLNTVFMRSLPSFTLSACMTILAIGLAVLYFVFGKSFEMNKSTLYTAFFSILFAVYVFFETSFAQALIPNGYMLCYATLSLLALMPIPLIGIFLGDVSDKLRKYVYASMLLCMVNFLVQTVLNFAGIKSVRVMLPATHVSIITAIVITSASLFFTDRTEKPGARHSLCSAIPMIVGGIADIVLLSLNTPSPNNSMWFTIGVTVFIVYQLCRFVYGYFKLYRASLETDLLANMAYHDGLSGIENRNAYERRLKELSAENDFDRLCCIVADINDLKTINDTLGHGAGDSAIAAVGSILVECMPEGAAFYRTGGDEFVVLIERGDIELAAALAAKLADEAKLRGEALSIPITLATGAGQYAAQDGSIVDFIRRVDTLMYECKRSLKNGGVKCNGN